MRIVGSVERVENPSPETFRAIVHADRPVILTGVATNWEAFGRWNLPYFREAFGDQTLTVTTASDDAAPGLFDWRETQNQQSTLRDYLTMLEGCDGEPRQYLAGLPISDVSPELLKHFDDPEFAEQRIDWEPMLFFGARGSKTVLHYDQYYNLHALLTGSKRLLLVDHRQIRNVYPERPWRYCLNYSRVDVDNPDYERWPRFQAAEALEAELEAGEVIFIPSFWWHRVHTLELSIALAFWFGRNLFCWPYVRGVPRRLQRLATGQKSALRKRSPN
jgi:hypothetical protein